MVLRWMNVSAVVINWFNATNKSKFILTMEKKLFGIISAPYEKKYILKKIFIRFYLCTKLSNATSTRVRCVSRKKQGDLYRGILAVV